MDSDQTKLGCQHAYNTKNRHNFMLDTYHLSIFEKKLPPEYLGATLPSTLLEDLIKLSERKLKTPLVKQAHLHHPRVLTGGHKIKE